MYVYYSHLICNLTALYQPSLILKHLVLSFIQGVVNSYQGGELGRVMNNFKVQRN